MRFTPNTHICNQRPPPLSLSSVTRTHNTPRMHTQARQRQRVLPESEARTTEQRCRLNCRHGRGVSPSPTHPPACLPACLPVHPPNGWMFVTSEIVPLDSGWSPLSRRGLTGETASSRTCFFGFLVRLDATEREDHTPSASSASPFNSQPLAC